jgi:hypothetical protein
MNRIIEMHSDTIAEKLDEMADLSEHWKRYREKGRNPSAIRVAMMLLAHEVTAIARAHDKETASMMDRLCCPTVCAADSDQANLEPQQTYTISTSSIDT